jgi:acetyl-CoA carboxylase carboxyltransferase component
VIDSAAPTPVFGHRSEAASAALREIDGRTVAWFSIEGGKHRGAIGVAEGETVERVIRLACQTGMPIVGRIASSGADVTEGVSALHAWGRIAKAMADASGVVPIVLVAVGPAVSGPALLLGLADHVVMTRDAFAFVSGPDVVTTFTGVTIDRHRLGGVDVHARGGLATMVVDDADDGEVAVRALLNYLPSNHLEDPPAVVGDDAVDRDCHVAAGAVPTRPNASYDVRVVIGDVMDHESFLELRAAYAPNIVTGLARLGSRTVGVVANQPAARAGTLDIEASRKAARFVQWCDAFNIPLVTFVDTPGFEPGRDLERRGMIRHGAELVHAYAAATVPRLCVVLRKAFGGAYIVMDSKRLGNDWCVAWPTAEIAVLGAAPSIQILYGRKLRAIADADARRREQDALEAEYADRFLNPYLAADRGYVDAVIVPTDTRRVLVDALSRVSTKVEHRPSRRHSNTPL